MVVSQKTTVVGAAQGLSWLQQAWRQVQLNQFENSHPSLCRGRVSRKSKRAARALPPSCGGHVMSSRKLHHTCNHLLQRLPSGLLIINCQASFPLLDKCDLPPGVCASRFAKTGTMPSIAKPDGMRSARVTMTCPRAHCRRTGGRLFRVFGAAFDGGSELSKASTSEWTKPRAPRREAGVGEPPKSARYPSRTQRVCSVSNVSRLPFTLPVKQRLPWINTVLWLGRKMA